MIYLVEFDAYNLVTSAVEKQRFSTHGYVTEPNDTPANTAFDEKVQQPGQYERTTFSNGTTSGEPDVTFGFIELANADGALDYLARCSVDGRALAIYGLESVDSAWSSRKLLFSGTMEQVELSWTVVTIRIRDRLFDLKKPLQPTLYLGTTTAGGQNTAEGNTDDLKDKPKPLLFGSALNFTPILANRFDLIYQVTSRTFNSGIVVRDNGVPLTFTQNYDTIQALRTATMTGGQYATATALGLFRIAAKPAGQITVDATESASGQRSAARNVQRLLEFIGLPTNAYSVSDLDTLHALNPADTGIWIGADTVDRLDIIAQLLDSVGATCVPDRLGVLRFFRIDAPTGTAIVEYDRSLILDRGTGIERVVTNDEGRGLPAKKLTLQYGYNYTTQTGTQINNTAATEAVKAFASEEWRTVVVKDDAVATAFLMAQELTFSSLLVNAADAQTEANRRLSLYKVQRDRYRVPIKTEYVDTVNLGSIVSLRLNRFGLNNGKKFLVIGMTEDFANGTTILDLYG